MGTIYLAGRINGDPDYRGKFRAAADRLEGVVLDPSVLPAGLTAEEHMKLCFAMIGCAGQAVFLPDFTDSPSALLELQYCRYIKKPVVFLAEEGDEPPERAEEEPAQVEPERAEGETAFPKEPDQVAEVREAAAPREGNAAWSGFLFLRCPVCGREHAFCAKMPLERYVCRACGAEVPLGEWTVAVTQCECGNHSKYRTNVEEACFDIPCVACGSPCTVEYRADRGRYEPVAWRQKRKKCRG